VELRGNKFGDSGAVHIARLIEKNEIFKKF